MQVEIDRGGDPLLVAFCQKGRNETQAGCGIGEDGSHASPALELAVNPFEAVGGTQANAMRASTIEHREALGQILLSPLRQLGCLDYRVLFTTTRSGMWVVEATD